MKLGAWHLISPMEYVSRTYSQKGEWSSLFRGGYTWTSVNEKTKTIKKSGKDLESVCKSVVDGMPKAFEKKGLLGGAKDRMIRVEKFTCKVNREQNKATKYSLNELCQITGEETIKLVDGLEVLEDAEIERTQQ